MEQERLYDLIFIARPATPEDEIKKVLTGIEHTCAEKGGKIEKTEHWGTRKLAYRVAKHREGIYVYQQIRTSRAEPPPLPFPRRLPRTRRNQPRQQADFAFCDSM